MVGGALFLAVVLAVLSPFLNRIEARKGVPLADPVVSRFEPVDATALTFALIYGAIAVAVGHGLRRPRRFVVMTWGYAFLLVARMVALWLVPLEPPATTIPLADPVVGAFVGGPTLTRDLFFSGHTSTTFLMGLAMAPSRLRWGVIALAPVVGALTVLQHVHYAVDVVVAFPVAWTVHCLARRLAPSPPA
jgi:membrane-associated phospholipid phosphatase